MNSRITEILENLAILSQALHSNQENSNTIDILGEIKLLSAQLYLESDMEIITSNKPEEVPVFEEEVIWRDIYENEDNCQDLEILENRLYEVPEWGLGENRVALQINSAKADFNLFLSKIGVENVQKRRSQFINLYSNCQ
jgi:hypothetical protein